MAKSRAGRGGFGLWTAILGFIAGALSVFVFHQLAIWGLSGRTPWSNWAPVPPFGVPAMLNIAFWGGLWGVLLAYVARRFPGGLLYFVCAFAFGAIFPPLVSWYVVPLIKGGALGPRGVWYNSAIINGMWGLGAGIFLHLLRRFNR
ncbi:MAG: hypothetical protein JWN93_225 [Hyphomicrobiales bacterium]|jgi:hypothetical protein|nr:hypothetical protein [Hyphomicrobiales bacterium]